ncbi:MAG: AAA family ATPase, partial [Campylobacterota bacterium]|nr:AAA family ATPase [Campylobacterota bacterium]
MYLNKIHIQNFKSLKDVTLQLNPQLNVFTGINNSGKTTILEAISLWNECFYKLITTADKGSSPLKLTKGDYKLGHPQKTPKSYFDYRDIQSIRTTSYNDIFYNLDPNNTIHIAVTLKSETRLLKIEFIIEKSSGSNYQIYLANYKTFSYPLFNDFFKSFLYPIKTIFASPTAKLGVIEEYKSNPQIQDRVHKRASATVFRNRLDKLLRSRDGNAESFIRDISMILSDSED